MWWNQWLGYCIESGSSRFFVVSAWVISVKFSIRHESRFGPGGLRCGIKKAVAIRSRWFHRAYPGRMLRCVLNQNQNCLLVTRQNDNHSPGPGPGRVVPISHQRSELSNTILGTFNREDKRVWKCILVPNGLGEATLININVSDGDLICYRMAIPTAPNQGG